MSLASPRSSKSGPRECWCSYSALAIRSRSSVGVDTAILPTLRAHDRLIGLDEELTVPVRGPPVALAPPFRVVPFAEPMPLNLNQDPHGDESHKPSNATEAAYPRSPPPSEARASTSARWASACSACQPTFAERERQPHEHLAWPLLSSHSI